MEASRIPTEGQPVNHDPGSDNDASEKSARDQLKKTSLASLANNERDPPQTGVQILEETQAESTETDPTTKQDFGIRRDGSPRGRSIRKRSLDRSTSPTLETKEPDLDPSEPFNGHSRKRSRDVRSGDNMKSPARKPPNLGPALEEEGTGYGGDEGTISRAQGEPVNLEGKNVEMQDRPRSPEKSHVEVLGNDARAQTSGSPDASSEPSKSLERSNGDISLHSEDHEMKEGIQSPRKKRSRDHLDPGTDREQKIAATDMARAQRRSDEINRAEMLAQSKASGDVPNQDTDSSATNTTEQQVYKHYFPTVFLQTDQACQSTSTASFGAPSSLRFGGTSQRADSPGKTSNDSDGASTQPPKAPSANAFASSGFASLASSSTSPFGMLSGSGETTRSNAFGASKSSGSASSGFQSVPTSSFGSLGKSSLSTQTASESSPFATAGASQNKTFGGSVFGGGFGGGFGSGPKLTSFAAPTGDATLGSANGTVKPIGSTVQDAAEENESGSEDDAGEGHPGDDEDDEADENFKQHGKSDQFRIPSFYSLTLVSRNRRGRRRIHLLRTCKPVHVQRQHMEGSWKRDVQAQCHR